MELTKEQAEHITKFVLDWQKDKKLELETTFGDGGVVDSNTFNKILQRLRTKGFEVAQQEDHLNIITPNHIRLSLQGLGVLQSYCKDDTLQGKQFTVMFKDRAFPNSNVDILDYNIRFKVRREEILSNDDPRVVNLLSGWNTQKKAFRLIRRWSFTGKGIRIDMSIVRQTPNIPNKSEYQWTTKFLQKNILAELPRYEVEVELLHDTPYTNTYDKSLKALIAGVGEIQRAIQQNSLLIRNSVTKAVIEEYKNTIGLTDKKFRGVSPITLQIENITQEIDQSIPNIRTGYNVTDKADGLRAMGFVNKTGELYLIDQSMNIYRTGLQNIKCASSLVDGEWVTMSKDGKPINHYLLFDIYHYDNKQVSNLPFVTFKENVINNEDESRYNFMKEWYKNWSNDLKTIDKYVSDSNRLIIAIKKFEFASPNNDSIFKRCCASILDTSRIYHTDGLIITSNNQPIPDKPGVRFDYQFKWKPSKDNTVDFLINFEKDPDFQSIDKITTTIHPDNDTTIRYKTMRLYVGGSKDAADQNPRATILLEEPISRDRDAPIKYGPILFNPIEFPDTMANTCHLIVETNPETLDEYVMTEDTREPIMNRSIVEMRYDPSREPGWRWIPSRIRHDKTERLLREVNKSKNPKYSGTMNDEKVANSVWNSIHDPITESMIRSGNEEPTDAEIKDIIKTRETDISKKYYERKAPKQNLALVKGLQDFHNKYIKNQILLKSVLSGGKKTILDMACGKAGDLFKWYFNRAQTVVGIDVAGENITNPNDGAYKRYLELIKKFGYERVPRMAFAIGNSSSNIVDGSAGANPEERDILRTIFGRIEPEGPVPKYIQKHMAGIYRSGTDVAACMFALHYFFENKDTLNGFLKNLSETVKKGGYFIGCCFDGDKVFNLLRNVEKGHSKSGTEGDVPIWTITKDYDNEELIPDETSIGLPIDVEFISIGSTHKEYLVSFDFLKSKLSDIGFRLLTRTELYEIGLENSTNTFDASYRMAGKYPMSDSVKEFSFLNRWFIFKRAEDVDEVSDKTMRFDKDITKYNKTYELFNVVSSSKYSVLKPWHKQQVKNSLYKWFPNISQIKRIVDATAHIGVDSIHLSDLFPSAIVDSFEIVPEIYQKLLNNIKTFHKENKIHAHLEDVTLWQPTHFIDLLFVDPPWGGESYISKDSIDLFLQKEGNVENVTKNINNLIDKWMDSKYIKNIILKAPVNFNKSYLSNKYRFEEDKIINRAGKVAFYLLRIQSPIQSTDNIDEQEIKEEVKEEAKDEISLPNFDKKFQENEIFRFGIDARSVDTLGVKDEKGKKDVHVGRWIGLSAPFPIPDPDLKSEDGTPILYPTIEHYLAAMKLKLASNKPNLGVELMSTKGKIHQDFSLKRKAESIKYESPRDFELLADEMVEIRKKMTKTYLNQYRVELYENKWAIIKDKVLKDALLYRWQHDKRFRATIEAARNLKKYLLYSTKIAAVASEYGGVREQATGKIQGENKVGRFIMEIAGFKF